MKTITLPDELNIHNSFSIKVYDYKSTAEISKQQILLNKNTFSFLQEGNKEVFFNDSSKSIDNSEFLLMTSGHCLMTEKLSSRSNAYRSILFFFSTEDVLHFITKFNLHLEKPNNSPSAFSFQYDAFIQRFVDSLVDLSSHSIALQQNILSTKFEEIMLYLTEIKGIDFLYALVAENQQQQKFIQTVESSKLNKLTIKELAFLLNMSVSSFKREFQKQYQCSPSKWFQDQRLEHAAMLLKNHSKRPSEVYEAMGYESLSNFIQAFKKKFGITPKQYQSN
ncbi:helix-turn-helix domain-containing protein [Flammeovirga agarivorans]|uniref:Helix-turn-helix transcriptional regulator n=1 Tax=Flammeovirga agarivorans TaxID=2726742 RepID=A0A7X8SP84_9BACT|nr:helix-turn-helix domain-containing protein [Flammeovirga agarivorans]NLR93775.1 helix-turn-helix transcriptional regulator [Flammeovirga agarivorans]